MILKNVYVEIDNNKYDIDVFKFSDGAMNVQIMGFENVSIINNIISKIVFDRVFMNCNNTLILVGILSNILGIHSHTTIDIGYLPYARADRVFKKGMVGASAVSLQLLECLSNSVVIYDVHSIPTHITHKTLITKRLPLNTLSTICYPDKGAENRYPTLSKSIVMGKTRCLDTGAITGMKVVSGEEYIKDATITIVDDICDGGRTFIETAKVLKRLGSKHIILDVSFGIFSKGKDVIYESGIDEIVSKYTYSNQLDFNN